MNEILNWDYDNTHKDRKNYINIVVISYGLVEYVKGSKLVEYDEIVNSDHRGYLVNINIVNYFDNSNSIYDKINKISLNLEKRSYRKKFIDVIDHYIEMFKIKVKLKVVEKQRTKGVIESFDAIIMEIINKVR